MPLNRHGINGSSPDALDTIALSTIEIAGATDSAHKNAAVDSTANRTASGELSLLLMMAVILGDEIGNKTGCNGDSGGRLSLSTFLID